jgi:hypothetical protein
MCDPEKPIIIDDIADTGKELRGCYFNCVAERDELFIYKFFDRAGNEIIGDLHVGMQFNFVLDDRKWVLNITASSCDIVRGKWTGADNAEPDQSYQAQAGGAGADETNVATATA